MVPDRNIVRVKVRVFTYQLVVSLGIRAGNALIRGAVLEDFRSAAGDPSGWWYFCTRFATRMTYLALGAHIQHLSS